MDIVLIAGLWLPAGVWGDVADALRARGDRPIPVELPGVDDVSTSATLDDQIGAVLAAVDAADRPLVVGHSAACTLAWIAADRRADTVAGAVMIGGVPGESDSSYAAFFDIEDGVMPFPGWAPFEGADAADLDATARDRLAELAVPVPEGVALGRVVYGDERRRKVPVVVVCPEFSPEQAAAMIDRGDVPELGGVAHVELVGIDSGHWPMITRPDDLAQLLSAAAAGIKSMSAEVRS